MVENKNIKCLSINESKDLKSYGSVDSGAKSSVLTFIFTSSETFKKCLDFKYLNDFILHFYISDSLDIETTVGVNRFDKCSIVEFNENKNTIKIRGNNKQFFNMVELKLLRKDKIGNMLLDFGDEDANVEK